MPSGESISTLVSGFSGACSIGLSYGVHVSGHIVLAGAAGVLVAYSPAVGRAEPSDDPAIFHRLLEKSYGLLVAGGAGAGAGA